jgi:hypothetical protein
MRCASCPPQRQAEFTAEVNIHFRGVYNLNQPCILVFPKLLVCLDCGLSSFITPQAELARLADPTSPAGNETRMEMRGTEQSVLRNGDRC